MAHECPECGQTCYCNGDIDDCIIPSEESEMNCIHYKKCTKEDTRYEDDDD
jgi:hypothetical protein